MNVRWMVSIGLLALTLLIVTLALGLRTRRHQPQTPETGDY